VIEFIAQSLALFIYPFNSDIIRKRGYCWAFFSGAMAGLLICLLILAYVVFVKVGAGGISEVPARLRAGGAINFIIFPVGIGCFFVFLKWLGVQIGDQKDWR